MPDAESTRPAPWATRWRQTRTTTALLSGLSDPANEEAWRALVGRCQPIMPTVAAHMGAGESELNDVVQSSLSTFLDAWRRGQYDRSRGRLSGFLLTILRSRVLDLIRRRGRDRTMTPLDAADETSAGSADAQRIWMDERRHQILVAALAELRASGMEQRTLEAFELHAMRETSVAEVASRLGMSVEEVYDAQYRVSRRLRPIAARLDELYEDL